MRRGRNNSGIIGWVIAAVVIAAFAFMGFSPLFEKDDPKVTVSQQGYWNFRDPIHVNVEDASGLKSFKATLITLHDEWVVVDQNTPSKVTKQTLDILLPNGVRRVESASVVLRIEATDNSLWGLFMGNTYKEEFTLVIDQHQPSLSIIANSYKIQKGGSAIVVFKAEDANLESLKIRTNFGKTFIAQPFIKKIASSRTI